MVEISKTDKTFIKIEDTTMKDQKMMERTDFQEYIVNSWDLFTNEIGLPNIYYIGKEIIPHDTVNDRIDILAFNQNTDEQEMIIFELKRDNEKSHLIQAISYAGMINTWTSKDVIGKLQNNSDEVKQYFENNEINFKIKIILIAESFTPETILAADWLNTEYNLDISAYKIKLHNIDKKLVCEVDQIYPLKELSDAYEARKIKQTQQLTNKNKITWDIVKNKLKNDIGKEAIDYLISSTKYNQGDPSRRRFVTNISFKGINNLVISFREKYINIYSWVENKDEGKEVLKKEFGEHFIINEWKSGLSFNISTEEEFKKLKELFNI